MAGSETSLILGGAHVDLFDFALALDFISKRSLTSHELPLAVVSANLDHIKHFGNGGRYADIIAADVTPPGGASLGQKIEWLTLLDGAPLVAQAQRLTGRRWPRLAGSDLIGPILDSAMESGAVVGFLGGKPQTQKLLKMVLPTKWPNLRVAGWWAPDRPELTDERASREIAAKIAAANVDLLIVGLGKPLQELWIAEYGALTGAKTLLAFGAVVDFLAGRVARAPAWISRRGMEWAWRLFLEPRRLARRYLVDGPPAYLRVRRQSSLYR